jgi:uncharacterized protein
VQFVFRPWVARQPQYNLPGIIRWALKEKPDCLLSGHSHIASDRYDGVVRRINPGALRGADQYTVALLDMETDNCSY